MYIKKQNNKLEISDFGDEHALIKKINLFLDGQIIDSKIYLEFSLESIKKIKTYFLKYNLLYSADKDTSQILDSIKKFEDDFILHSSYARKIKYLENHTTSDFLDFVKVVDTTLIRKLFDYQLKAAYHMSFSKNSCNFSVPGSGKTSIVYAAYSYLKKIKEIETLVIIGPLSSFLAWKNEFQECFGFQASFLDLTSLDNDIKNDLLKFSYDTYDFIFINYEGTNNLDESFQVFLNNFKTMLVLDEAHKIKNPKALRTKNIFKFSGSAKSRVILTGTPLPNGYKDLYNMFEFIWPNKNLIGMRPAQLERLNQENNKEIIDSMLNRIDPFYVRISKKLLNLPEPIHHNPIIVEMDPIQKEIYNFIFEDFMNDDDLSLFLLKLDFKKSKLTRLMQASTNPSILKSYVDKNFTNSDISNKLKSYDDLSHNSKYSKTVDIVKNIIRRGEKVIIWTQYTYNLKRLSFYFSQLGIKNETLFGEIDNNIREKIINEFHTNDLLKVILANPAAVAESISLHKACKNAIYLDKSFNAAHYMQSKDRIHRVGLKKNDVVNYYYIFSKDSIDELVHDRLLMKEQRMLSVIEGKLVPLFDKNFQDEMSDEDLLYIFNYLRGK
jgi:SNF2 family DNA or RNA helicase